MKKYAIVGFGCAGYHAARAIRNTDKEGRIVVFNDTAEAPFNPMLSSYYTSERITLTGVFPFGSLEEIAKNLDLEIQSETSVKTVDTANKAVILADGTQQFFDAILISTGASAMVPGALKTGGGNYFLMRTLEDAKSLRKYIEENPVKRAVVVGGSMVGIKVAELLHNRGISTILADGAPYLFPLAAYQSTADKLQAKLSEQGLEFLFNAKVDNIIPEGIRLAGGEVVEADLVCLCIGTRTNLQVLDAQDININRGVIVDQKMRTSCPGIYAAGDCCEGNNLQNGKTGIIGLWANAGAQGDCAGANMAGGNETYYGNILHNITHFFHMDFIGLGDPTLPGERHLFEGEDFSIELVEGDGCLNSVNILGNYKISGILKHHLMKCLMGAPSTLSPVQIGLLKAEGVDQAFIDYLGGEKRNGST